MRKESNRKTSRLRSQIIELILLGKKYTNIANKFGVSYTTIRQFAIKNKLHVACNMAKTKRNDKILKLVKKGVKYSIIATKFGISKTRVSELAINAGIRRWESNAKNVKKIISNIEKDFKSGMSYKQLKRKYNLADNYHRLRYYGYNSIYMRSIKNRNERIVKEYSTKTAKKVLKLPSPILKTPNKIENINSVYAISSNNGFKKYPKIGKRCLGGCFENKKILKFIERKYNDGLSFNKISKLLNKLKYKTISGVKFTEFNTRFKYHDWIKNKIV